MVETIVITVLGAAISALVAWNFKMDQRIFDLAKQQATKEDFVRIEDKVDDLKEDVNTVNISVHKLIGAFDQLQQQK